MHWISLQNIEQLEELKRESVQQKILIFKHSTRCSISRTALDRLERNWNEEFPGAKSYFLDLLSYRDVSAAIAECFDVVHESPQVLVISDGKSIYDRSHFEIDFLQIKTILKN